MTEVSTVWATERADVFLAFMARVSNPSASPDDPNEKLIGYLIRKKHWSPFDMINMCVEINTTRDIGRQVLRHWSIMMHDLKAQEFSQRYADVSKLEGPVLREARLQDTKNRQSSLATDDEKLQEWWTTTQEGVWDHNVASYKDALERGIAKEQARALLPEGMTPTRFYLNGTARQWIHYLELRTDAGTQKEHRDVAMLILREAQLWAPVSFRAAEKLMTDRLSLRDKIIRLETLSSACAQGFGPVVNAGYGEIHQLVTEIKEIVS